MQRGTRGADAKWTSLPPSTSSVGQSSHRRYSCSGPATWRCSGSVTSCKRHQSRVAACCFAALLLAACCVAAFCLLRCCLLFAVCCLLLAVCCLLLAASCVPLAASYFLRPVCCLLLVTCCLLLAACCCLLALLPSHYYSLSHHLKAREREEEQEEAVRVAIDTPNHLAFSFALMRAGA